MSVNYKQIYAIQESNKKRILKVNSKVTNNSGIYFLTRVDEDGINYFYIGQAKHLLDRLSGHLGGYQHIDISLKKRGFISTDNPYGWKIGFIEYPESKLDDMEQYWILEYTKKGYQCRYNKTGGGQGKGKEKINEYRPSKTYHDGLKQGYINASKEIAHLFDLHLGYYTNNPMPTVNQKKALEKFEEFLNAYKNIT